LTNYLKTTARVGALMTLLALSGCASLLPTSISQTVSEWNSYDDAVHAMAALMPYQATRTDVHQLQLDPRRNPAVTVLQFSDILQRFAAAALIKPDEVDRGIRDCLSAGQHCTAYAIAVKKLQRQRVGNFWLDSLNFRRETVTTGWSVNILLVFVDDSLVYQLIGGQPTINEIDLRHNPLGPLQSWGDHSVELVR
jgi:hypothetical protein